MIRIRSLRARLSLALAGLVVVALAIVYAIVVPSLERNLADAKLNQLTRAVRGVATFPLALGADPAQVVRAWARATNARVAWLQPVGTTGPPLRVLATSERDAAGGDFADDPVAAHVLASHTEERGIVSRGDERYAEVALPTADGTSVVLFSASLEDTLATVRLVQRRVLIAGAVALAVALLLGTITASILARRLRRLERAAERIAGGTLDEPVLDSGSDEVGQLATAFEHMRRRLLQLEHARREFVANASHELRTPIFSLSGFLELLASEDLDEGTRAEFLASMQEQVERLTTLAAELLDLSRLDAGQLRVEREPVELGAVAQVLADEFRAVARASGHEIELAADPGAVAPQADGQRVLQIGRALVENAIRHTPRGTHVVLVAASDGAGASLAVEDDGPGIAREHQEHVFDRFYRVDGARASGSGLGLAIARELAELMGGRLELRTQPGRTVFHLVFPATAPSRTPPSTPRDSEPVALG